MNYFSPFPRGLVGFLSVTVLFALAYCQAPLYYSNQNQYFLHGLARAGYGQLHEDWLANTSDPTPIFSTMVAWTAEYLAPVVFYGYHAVLLGIYAWSLLSIFKYLVGPERAEKRWLMFFALIMLAHAALPRWLSQLQFDFDYPWFLQAGLAGQYVLGGMLQPSVFGVLLVAAVAAFLHGRIYAAGLLIALAGTIHSTYLLLGAMLTAGFLAELIREGSPRKAFNLGAFTLLLVLPVTLYVYFSFRPTPGVDFQRSQEILATIRIPHHCLPRLWMDNLAMKQIAWMALAVALTWRTRLFLVMAIPFAMGILLTWLQDAMQSVSLALLFPWRISAILMPLSTTVIVTRLLSMIQPKRPMLIGSVLLLLALVGSGVGLMFAGIGFRGGDEDRPVMDHVKLIRKPGDVFLLPIKINPPKPGALSSDFKKPAEKKTDVQIIPVELIRFRLYTNSPIYVDLKAIPYKDSEVLEWYQRLTDAISLQTQIQEGKSAETLPMLRERKITHVIVPSGKAKEVPGFSSIYKDDYYELFQVE